MKKLANESQEGKGKKIKKETAWKRACSSGAGKKTCPLDEGIQQGFPRLIKSRLISQISGLTETVRVVLESTGYYHWPLVNSLLDAGIFVCIVNPILMSKFSKVQMRPGKTDRLDAVQISKFELAHWNELVCCTPDEEGCQLLRLYSRQYSHAVQMMS